MGALLKAQKAIEGVSKDKTHSFSHYKYTSSEHLVSVARRVLIENGLVVGRRNWSFEGVTNDSELLKVKSRLFVSHPESGESFDEDVVFPAIVRKGTAADKAICASLSTSLAYWLRDILLLPRMDEAESMDRRNDTVYKLNQQVTKEIEYVN